MTFSYRMNLGVLVLLGVVGEAPVLAATTVAPNAFADAAGYEYQASIFGNGSTGNVTFQEGIAAAELSTVPVGAVITGVGYRLAANLPTFTDTATYSDFTVRIGGSAVPIANLSLSAIANEGADTITARTGAFTMPGGSLVNTGSLNPFYSIVFTSPYTYNGGDLLLTTSYSVSGAVPFIGVDAVDAFGSVNTLGGTDPAFLRTHTFNAPVVQFTFGSAVPEPASWIMLAGGFGLVGSALRRARRSAVA